MTRRMAESWYDSNTWKNVFFSIYKRTHAFPFGKETMDATDICMPPLWLFFKNVGLGPIIKLLLRHNHLRIGEDPLICLTNHHSVDMICMEVG